MKNASLITNVVLSVAVIVLFILHFTSKSNPTKSNIEIDGTQVSSGSIVYIQMDSLINKYDSSMISNLSLKQKFKLLRMI